jgi:chromosome segregation ATPase
MENLEEASNKQIVELKILKKDFDDLNSNYRISCKKLDEEFQKYVKLVGEHERTKQNLDNKISENTKQKYELQNMNDKYQKMRRKCEKKNRAIKLMQEKKEELISDAKKAEKKFAVFFENSYSEKIKVLKTGIRHLETTNKHILQNPKNILTAAAAGETKEDTSKLIISYEAKIKYLTEELERLEIEKTESSKLETLNASIIKITNKNDQFEEILTKLTKTLAEKEIELLQSELKTLDFKTRIFHLQDTIIELESSTLQPAHCVRQCF